MSENIHKDCENYNEKKDFCLKWFEENVSEKYKVCKEYSEFNDKELQRMEQLNDSIWRMSSRQTKM